jgi:hypothetical protein
MTPDEHAHVRPFPERAPLPPRRRAEDQAQLRAIGAAYDHVVDSGDRLLSFHVVARICEVYHAHLKQQGGEP